MTHTAPDETPPDHLEQVAFFVQGTPAPQGSKKMIGPWRMIDDNPIPLKVWRKAVQEAATTALAGRNGFEKHAPLVATFRFHILRGKTVKRNKPVVTPDTDKLARAVGDALTISKLWHDDAQVIHLTATKEYAPDHPGVHITVRRTT